MNAASSLPVSPLLGQRERLWPVVLVSLVAHAGIIAVAVFHPSSPPIDLQQKPIVAKLVRLGEKRPEQWLPRKDAPAPPAATTPQPVPIPSAEPPKPQPKTAPVPVAKPVEAPKPAPPNRGPTKTGRTDVLASVMSRVEKEKVRSEPLYGDPSGVAGGDATEAGPGDVYLGLVERALRDSYTLPATLSDRDRMTLKATVVLYLEADGSVVRYAFETRSGNSAFDSALERAIRAARLPPPPAELRRKYRTEGLGVLYRP